MRMDALRAHIYPHTVAYVNFMLMWLQKRVIRIITGSRPRDSCRQLYKKLGILTLMSQYILFLLLFILKTKLYFKWILKFIVLIQHINLIFISH
jgi:hypothetical protein